MPLKPADKAPDFTLLDQHGEPFSLSKQRKVWHLVYFYPKAGTPGCTAQSCGLRDVAVEIGDTVVLGISPDPPARQARFDEKHALGFPLLADEDHAVAEAYGAWGEKSLYGKRYMGIIRSAFLVDGQGRIAEAWYKVSPKDTATNLLRAIGAPGGLLAALALALAALVLGQLALPPGGRGGGERGHDEGAAQEPPASGAAGGSSAAGRHARQVTLSDLARVAER